MEGFSIETLNEKADKSEIKLLIRGFLDAHTVAHFEKSLDEVHAKEYKTIILDFSRLNYISSAGIGSLMNYTKMMKDKGGELIIFRPTDKVYRIFDLLGFSMIFNIQR